MYEDIIFVNKGRTEGKKEMKSTSLPVFKATQLSKQFEAHLSTIQKIIHK